MKHRKKKESGKMFIDIAKYIVTVKIGNFLSEKMPLDAAIAALRLP